jgi:hypothetical protein
MYLDFELRTVLEKSGADFFDKMVAVRQNAKVLKR